MYKIYINDKPIHLLDFKDYKIAQKGELAAIYHNKPVTLFQYIDSLEKGINFDRIKLYARDVEKLKDEFFKLYKEVHAAGGAVMNDEGEILAIFRRGHWDLPKGKVEKGESIEDAAVREVQEETGVSDVVLQEKIGETYHTFVNAKGKRVMKVSHWFKMKSSREILTPQVEEDIEKAEWIDLESFKGIQPIYPNIKDVVVESNL